EILKSSEISSFDQNLLVGNSSKDDAAVYDMGNGSAIISTTDFFMPIVDDPFDFGSIASVNAISDVYAMGGKPMMAIAILGWPVNSLPPDVAKEVLNGSRSICKKAGISLGGGHSIDTPEPIFGLAVTGIVEKKNLKRNNSAKINSQLYLSKPLGVGIVTTAHKKGIADESDLDVVIKSMLTLNDIGFEFGGLEYVNAMTDVTGFGLLGHLCEMCEGSGLSAEIEFKKIPKFNFLDNYLGNGCIPGGTERNWNSYKDKISPLEDYQKNLLADPQTSGGLLISVDGDKIEVFEDFMKTQFITNLTPIGKLVEKRTEMIVVK
ncbi:MAG: selenide, water dikinase SelD, partial [Bacteroidetes bacterium]|nr:selenide, water dikinase SelD [Bacteroidota bacterium]